MDHLPRTLAAIGLWMFAATSVAGCAVQTATPEDEAASADELSVNANEKLAFQFFVNKGLSKVAAAAIVGNLQQESGTSATAVQSGGPGRGVAQWSTGGRWNSDYHDNVAWFAARRGQSPWSLQLQLEFIWYELNTFPQFGLGALEKSTSIGNATLVFMKDFEICGACASSQRIAYATAVYKAMAH